MVRNRISKQQLVNAGPEKLAAILISLYDTSNEFQKVLDASFAGLSDDPKPLISAIKKQMRSIKGSDRFIHYQESDKFSEMLDRLRIHISKDLQQKSPSEAVDVMLKFLDLHEGVLNRSDDSSGDVSGVFFMAVEDLGHLLKADEASVYHAVDLIFPRLMDNPFGIYDKLIFHCKEALKSEGLSLLKGRLKKSCNQETSRSVQLELLSIADAKEDVDAYIEACSFMQTPSSYDFLEIAKRLIQHKRPKKALEYLEKIEDSGHFEKEISEIKIKSLEMLGDKKKANNIKFQEFKRLLTHDLYQDVLSSLTKESQQEFSKEAIKFAFNFHNPHSAIEFLIDIEEMKEAARYVRQNIHQINGSLYFILRPIAKTLSSLDPISASLIYRKLADDVLDRKVSKYYPYAAKDLVSCMLLSDQVDDWEQFQSHQDYFKELENKHKRKSRFWVELDQAKQRKNKHGNP